MPLPPIVSSVVNKLISTAVSKATSLVGGFADTSNLPAIGGMASLLGSTSNVGSGLISVGAGAISALASGAGSTGSIAGAAGSAVSGVSSNISAGLSSDISKFETDVDEVTINSSYYPAQQPFLARMIMVFPKGVYDETIISTTVSAAPSKFNTGMFNTTGVTSPATSFGQSPGGFGLGTSTIGTAASPFNTSPSLDLGVTAPSTTTTTSQIPVFNNANESVGDILEVRPNNFLSLDYNRIFRGIGRFTITLFDPKWDFIETKLCASKGFFRFKYGYTDETMSPWYIAKALNYSLDYGMEGVTITISGLTEGYSLGFTQTYSALNIKNEIISDIALSICKAFGSDWISIIEPTAPVLSREGLDTTDVVNKLMNLTADSHLQGIINQLCKYAVNKKGQGNYVFFIRNTPEGKSEFHFHTVNYDPQKSSATPVNVNEAGGRALLDAAKADLSFEEAMVKARAAATQARATNSQIASATGKTPGFTQFKNKNTALIKYNPSWSMTLAQLTGGGGTASAIIDTNSKTISLFTPNMADGKTPQKMDGNSNRIEIQKPKDYIPDYLKKDVSMEGFNILQNPDRSPAQNEAATRADFSRSYPGAIRASLTIFGTPNFYITQKIAVIIYRPQGDNSIPTTSNIHWLSGFFRIMGIKDSVRSGTFTTTFDLVSDGRSAPNAPDQVKTL